MKRWEFFALLRKIEYSEDWQYSYSFGNDEYRNNSKWQRRTADYCFRMFNGKTGENYTLQSGTTKGDVYQLKEDLELKFNRWVASFNKLTTLKPKQ